MKKLVVKMLLLSACGYNSIESNINGDFRTNFVEDEYLLYDTHLYWEDVKESIMQWSVEWRNTRYTRNQIAWKIYAISSCLNIDPIVYSSLIFTESNYISLAVSPTGAVGLTQFTNIGIKEVNDQLGRRGSSYAKTTSMRYFNSVIKNCISELNGISNYRKLWTFKEQKKRLLENADHSLIYGAIYLKSLLSVAKYESNQLDTQGLYFEALRRYNNDPKVRDQYARKTLSRAGKFYLEKL